MTYERTRIRVDGAEAVVETYPWQFDDVPFEYRLRRVGHVWVLDQPREEYTDHAIDYARREMDEDVVEVHVHPAQTGLADYESDHPSDDEVGVAATAAASVD